MSSANKLFCLLCLRSGSKTVELSGKSNIRLALQLNIKTNCLLNKIRIYQMLDRRKTARMQWTRTQQHQQPADPWQRPALRYLQLGFNLGLPWFSLPTLPGKHQSFKRVFSTTGLTCTTRGEIKSFPSRRILGSEFKIHRVKELNVNKLRNWRRIQLQR